jgi:hypothetical protein
VGIDVMSAALEIVVDSPVRNSLTPATEKLFTLENGGGLSS